MLSSEESSVSSINALGVRNIAALGSHLQPYPGTVLYNKYKLDYKEKEYLFYYIIWIFNDQQKIDIFKWKI